MTDTPSSMVRLDAYQSDNWGCGEIPVAILNNESTLHQQIGYCWGLANQLHVLCDLLAHHENPEIRQIGTLFESQVQPLEAMLQKMGGDTKPKPSDKA